jgi:hypothetical protein
MGGVDAWCGNALRPLIVSPIGLAGAAHAFTDPIALAAGGAQIHEHVAVAADELWP